MTTEERNKLQERLDYLNKWFVSDEYEFEDPKEEEMFKLRTLLDSE